MITADSNTYWYDAVGRRFYTNVGGTPREFLYDVAGHTISMSRTSPSSWDRGEIYAGGWHIASYAASTTEFNHTDWLGTVRVRTGPTGAVINSYTSLPFGDCFDQNDGSTCDGLVGATPAHFTDQDRDAETGLDHFLYRQYSSVQGRWMRPDPAGMAAVSLGNPQTWNLYAYVANNPINGNDPLGLDDCQGNEGDDVIPCGGDEGGGVGFFWDQPHLRTCSGWQGSEEGGSFTGCQGINFPGTDAPQDPGKGGEGRLPNIPPVIPRKGFCSYTAIVGNLPLETLNAIQQIFNGAGVGVDFIHGPAADLMASFVPLPDVEIRPGVFVPVYGNDSSGSLALVNSLNPYPITQGIILAHEWGHYLIPCSHGAFLNPCGETGLMASGPNHPNGGTPSPTWSPQDPGFQFTGEQAIAIRDKCRALHS